MLAWRSSSLTLTPKEAEYMKPHSLPVFPNWFPYNDMLLDGHLKVDEWAGVKTRGWKWDYRGPVLFYNSGRTADAAVDSYKYTNSPYQHKVIIGVGELADVRTLTKKEAERMVCNFNNMPLEKVRRILKKEGFSRDQFEDGLYQFYLFGPYVAPLEVGFFFKNLKRFSKPVTFNWPPGPVKPIYTKITTGSELQAELKRLGF